MIDTSSLEKVESMKDHNQSQSSTMGSPPTSIIHSKNPSLFDVDSTSLPQIIQVTEKGDIPNPAKMIDRDNYDNTTWPCKKCSNENSAVYLQCINCGYGNYQDDRMGRSLDTKDESSMETVGDSGVGSPYFFENKIFPKIRIHDEEGDSVQLDSDIQDYLDLSNGLSTSQHLTRSNILQNSDSNRKIAKNKHNYSGIAKLSDHADLKQNKFDDTLSMSSSTDDTVCTQ